MASTLKERALQYHREPRPGKIETHISVPAETADDLALAYSPGVAEPCLAIEADADKAYDYTSKGNLVGVITNGTAVLGLGNLGALASKPVMEGKGLLFKKFADINVFDIEVDCNDVDEFVETVARISCTFGAINLEDIKAPECFEIERRLQERLDIPVFHDDQHGTAVVTAAGMLNALELSGKSIENSKVVCLGAGAAAMSCSDLLASLGMPRENLVMLDSKGVIHSGRTDLNPWKERYAHDTNARTLNDACQDADVFLGLSGANLLGDDALMAMAPNAVIFAMANPDPEIRPERARELRDDLIIATGRSDYVNQVNNVLCFPFIFRGALDVGAREINEAMMLACVHALRDLAREPVPAEVLKAYGLTSLEFGSDYVIPKPVDPRLREVVAGAVSRAAIETGIARKSL